MSDSEFLRKPLLKAPLSSWAHAIQQQQIRLERRIEKFGSLVLYHSRLSNILDQRHFSGPEKTFLFSESVDIALFRLRKDGAREAKIPCAALDLDGNASPTKQVLFERCGLPYVTLPEEPTDACVATILDALQQYWQKPGSGNKYLAKRLDFAEAEKILHLAQLLKPMGLIYLPQQGLSDFLSIPDSHRDVIKQRIEDHRLIHKDGPSPRFDELTTVDGVIATGPPASIPIAAIEFDGNVHRDRSNQDLAKKKLKDELENGIAEKSRLPLIRFAHGPDVGEQNEALGWQVLEGFIRTMLEIVRDDAHQALSMYQMLLAEVRALQSDAATNIEALMSDYLKILEQRAAKHEREQAESRGQNNSCDPYWPHEYSDEVYYSQVYRMSVADGREAEFFNQVVRGFDTFPELTNYYQRSIQIEPTEGKIGYRAKCVYRRLYFDIPSVDEGLQAIPETLEYVTKNVIPLKVFGSNLAKNNLQDLCQYYLRPIIAKHEQTEYSHIAEACREAVATAEGMFWDKKVTTDLRGFRNVAEVESYIRRRIGLNRLPEISTTEEDDGRIAYVKEERYLRQKLDRYIRLLVDANRDDLLDDEVELLRDELGKSIEDRLSKLEFWTIRDADREDTEFVRNLARSIARHQSGRPHGRPKWKLGQKPRLT